jgi:DNA-binding FadR family transcriptional regulator
VARLAIEPHAAHLLAAKANDDVIRELENLVGVDLTAARDVGHIQACVNRLHRLIVALAGNETLSLLGTMIADLIEGPPKSTASYTSASEIEYRHLLETASGFLEHVRARDGTAAEQHWRHHLETTLEGLVAEGSKVRLVGY